MYTYKAKVIDVYDGDSITVDIDLGFGIMYTGQKIRLADIDAPELRGEEREAGLVSKEALKEKIEGKEITLVTRKDKKGKYGRYIGLIYIEEEVHDETLLEEGYMTARVVNVNEWMVNEGYAEFVIY